MTPPITATTRGPADARLLRLLGPAMVGAMRGFAASLFNRMVAVGGLP